MAKGRGAGAWDTWEETPTKRAFAIATVRGRRTGGNAVIRQAISCDICGAEKKQTNHWFVASEQNGELRVSGWNSRNRLKAGTKHLCGQTCLHKLVDEFMARTIASRTTPGVAGAAAGEGARAEIDASLTSPSSYHEPDSSARLLPVSAPVEGAAGRTAPRPVEIACSAVFPMTPRFVAEPATAAVLPLREDEAPAYSSRRWRAEAWERERSRELRAIDSHPDIARRRKGL